LSYIGLFLTKESASLFRLLKALFQRPLPLLSAAYVGVSESQFGQSKRRFTSALLRHLPSMWSATKGTFPVFGLISAQPHKQHLSPNFSLKYLFTCAETTPVAISPSTSPFFQFCMYVLYLCTLWQTLLQYLDRGRGVSFLQARHLSLGNLGFGTSSV